MPETYYEMNKRMCNSTSCGDCPIICGVCAVRGEQQH